MVKGYVIGVVLRSRVIYHDKNTQSNLIRAGQGAFRGGKRSKRNKCGFFWFVLFCFCFCVVVVVVVFVFILFVL